MAGPPGISFYPGDVPEKPGVYVFRDRFGEVIYVGKATNLRRRMSQYFHPSLETRADPKLRSMVKSIERWEFFPVKSEDEALVLESRFIKEYAPRYNILMRDDKRYLMIKINLSEQLPRFSLARIRKDDNCKYFGPFPKGSMMKQTVDFLSRYFKIRACLSALPDEKDHKHCMSSRIKDCCAPCVGKISAEDYRKRVDEMLKVLEGDIKELVEELQKRMKDAAASMSFEKAARWRDVISNVQEVFGKHARSFRFSFIPSASGNEAVEDLKTALGLPALPNVIEGYDISNIGGQFAVASLVCFENGRPSRKNYRRFKIRDVHQSDDFAMMKEVIKRRFKRLMEENRKFPDLVMVDGGKGQLSAALEGLLELKVPPLPLIGLAKRNEEIFLPGRENPVVLDRHRPALRLLQALRDEAHRFAVTYHRALRGRRIQESMLDEIEGVGPSRRKAILTAFGSIRELRKAAPEEIMEKVPGVGKELALLIYSRLRRNKTPGQL